MPHFGDGLLEGGSSPRGRGKRPPRDADPGGPGLIPAWAGKTPPTGSRTSPMAAHPRVGGENEPIKLVGNPDMGSSPRGRGKRGSRKQVRDGRRLIPAWAGKTICEGDDVLVRGAHPRVGGENDWTEPNIELIPGSSPRGRGKPGTRRSAQLDRGLIPAWAGKTSRRACARLRCPAHPRVGGENDPVSIVVGVQ